MEIVYFNPVHSNEQEWLLWLSLSWTDTSGSLVALGGVHRLPVILQCPQWDQKEQGEGAYMFYHPGCAVWIPSAQIFSFPGDTWMPKPKNKWLSLWTESYSLKSRWEESHLNSLNSEKIKRLLGKKKKDTIWMGYFQKHLARRTMEKPRRKAITLSSTDNK